MPHSIFGPNQWGINQVIQTGGTSSANIRNLIDQGFAFTTHFPAPIKTIGPGGPIGLPSPGPGSNGIMIPGGIPSTIPWGDIIRDGIDKLFGSGGGGGSGFQEEPIKDRPFIPEFIDKMLSGTIPRGGTPYITLPDGTVGCPSGFHPEKAGKGYCVRNRRMNALNPRALSRASRRVGGFARAVKRARTLKKICRIL